MEIPGYVGSNNFMYEDDECEEYFSTVGEKVCELFGIPTQNVEVLFSVFWKAADSVEL